MRAVVAIDTSIPSRACIEANAHTPARYAALCQEVGLVPIIEPEVLMDGDHTTQRWRLIENYFLQQALALIKQPRKP
jgi:fructose-bisphosphate aldolase class 1